MNAELFVFERRRAALSRPFPIVGFVHHRRAAFTLCSAGCGVPARPGCPAHVPVFRVHSVLL